MCIEQAECGRCGGLGSNPNWGGSRESSLTAGALGAATGLMSVLDLRVPDVTALVTS